MLLDVPSVDHCMFLHIGLGRSGIAGNCAILGVLFVISLPIGLGRSGIAGNCAILGVMFVSHRHFPCPCLDKNERVYS